MPTIHYTKKKFLEELDKLIQDDEHIILTNEVDGTIGLAKKKKLKKIPFVFASDAFAKQDTVSDLLNMTLVSFIIAEDVDVADQFKHENNENIKKG